MNRATMTLMLAISCSACSEAAHHEHRTQTASIIDGTADSTSGVLGLARTDGAGFGSCSAVLIAPRFALTSQNCVLPSNGGVELIICGESEYMGLPAASSLFVTNAPMLGFNQDDYVGVLEVLLPEDRQVCGNDIAMLVLDAELEEPIPPELDELPQADQVYTAHGYGSIASPGQGAGVRRVGPGTVTCVGGGCDPALPDSEFSGVDGACDSDGGGPAIAESGRVIGLVVRGSGACETSVLTTVPAWSDWIVENTRAQSRERGFELPDWAGPPFAEDMGAGELDPEPDMGSIGDVGDDPDPDLGAIESNEAKKDGGCSTTTAPNNFVWTLLLAVVLVRRRR